LAHDRLNRSGWDRRSGGPLDQPTFSHVTPNIFKLDLPMYLGFGRVGVWLVREDDGWTLLDTGSPHDAPTVLKATLAHTRGEAPRRIILTHGHLDHAGTAGFLQERWSIPVLAHREERHYIEGTNWYGSVRPAWWGFRLIQEPFGLANRIRPPRIVDVLADGDRVGSLEVRHVPGHTPGMIALIHRRDRAIVAGDTFVSRGLQLYPPAKFFTPDPPTALRSMGRLVDEDFDHLLASHGRPILRTGRTEALLAVRRVSRTHA
jgi:glyoxylase-like metal-dependent hydrolase (beta-lactamase superfamily II)